MITSTQNAEHYIWGKECDGWHLLNADSLSVIQERMPPGTGEQLHYHERAQQVFYILSGMATFEVDGELKTVSPGESIHINPSTRHRIFNNGDEDLHFLVISEPKAHGDRVNCPL
ncbi:mannose-6-phosphate isomerase-like protein (cupin superfamily) [Mucilaginibacter frigoritolerans]|uniref:Mannose-6-phosphate isomerase-like protein (Cupin superfamily) n=1 Tax=Mucilaginibacter frigoritolerans TaxID=652788 RepID=A0A562UCB3_9SPHI|nr:cupin domain-containing protein [Mucilaginibacter frigoritolerans]TWJ03428.1 mannose-6-phosphate isomerase-like protein (cupin superfamily) [Mucilaginibacter frigoritolerans]